MKIYKRFDFVAKKVVHKDDKGWQRSIPLARLEIDIKWRDDIREVTFTISLFGFRLYLVFYTMS